MRDELTRPEIKEWWQLYLVDPWDQDRADLRVAHLAAAILAQWSKEPPDPLCFMHYFSDKEKEEIRKMQAEKPQQTMEEQKALIRGVKHKFNRQLKTDSQVRDHVEIDRNSTG